jgi:hypothetical protein
VLNDLTGESAYQVYREYENLPKTLTCIAVEESLGVTAVIQPRMSTDNPFLLVANLRDGRPAMVKLLRISRAEKIAEYHMERDALGILDFSGAQPGLVQARCVEFNVLC